MVDEKNTRVGRTVWDFTSEVVLKFGPIVTLVAVAIYAAFYYIHEFETLRLRADQEAFERIQLAQDNTIELANKMNNINQNLIKNITSSLALTDELRRRRADIQKELALVARRESAYVRAFEALDLAERDITKFLKEKYAPDFFIEFSKQFQLPERVVALANENPSAIPQLLTMFVETGLDNIASKRREILSPVTELRRQLFQSTLNRNNTAATELVDRISDKSVAVSRRIDSVVSSIAEASLLQNESAPTLEMLENGLSNLRQQLEELVK